MTPARLLALVVAAFAVGAGAPFLLQPAYRAAAPEPAAAVRAAPSPPAAPAGEPAAGAPSPDLRDVSPGILSRAAASRALGRGAPPPACSSAARPEAPACAPARETVEVRWDVRRDP